MDDSLLMGFVDRQTDLLKNVDDPFKWEAFFFRENIAKRAPIEILHDEVGNSALLDPGKADVGYVAHIRVSQTTSSTRLTFETFDKLRIAHELWRDEFEGDIPFGTEVRGEIDCSHTALSEEVLEAVLVVENL